jgi:hypothetical protein
MLVCPVSTQSGHLSPFINLTNHPSGRLRRRLTHPKRALNTVHICNKDKSVIKIRLWELVGTGLIIAAKTGIVYANQAGGKICLHMELEGVFIPVGNDVDLEGRLLSPEVRLSEHFLCTYFSNANPNGLTKADAEAIEAALHQNLLLRNVTVDLSRLQESHEAWVYVVIGAPPTPLPPFEGLVPFPLKGVLTWSNNS